MQRFRMHIFSLIICFLTLTLYSYGKSGVLTDVNATSETKALFRNLKEIQNNRILVGHHDATAYGHNWFGDANRSDIKDVCGSHPAMIGFDFSIATNSGPFQSQKRLDEVVKRVVETYERGAVVTFCWHSDNPLTGETAWVDTAKTVVNTVKELLPGGKAHDAYKKNLESIANLAKAARTADGTMVPIIFRPFHEMEGNWFWWGRQYRTPEEFKDVWRFTVEYLRDSLEVHNFLYAYSSDCKFKTAEQYLTEYPGDEYVDVLGMDDYWDFRPDGANDPQAAADKIKIVSDLAHEKGKLAALTETGLESISDSTWFTQKLLPALRSKGAKLAYVMLWRNDSRMKHHFYAPFPGHNSVPDFLKFYNDDYTLFENDLKNIYVDDY